MSILLPPQKEALSYIEARTRLLQALATTNIDNHLEQEGVKKISFLSLLDKIRSKVLITLHFHPGRLCPKGYIVAEGLLKDGFFKNQFGSFSASIFSNFNDDILCKTIPSGYPSKALF